MPNHDPAPDRAPEPVPAADVLRCGSCGGAIGNDALVAGECSYCKAGLQLPRRPDKPKSARIISKPGAEMVVRVDEGGGIGVETFDEIVWDPNADAKANSDASTAPPGSARAGRLWLPIVVMLVLAGVVLAAVTLGG